MPVIYVIHDDVSVRETLASLARTAGWQPETFADGRTFLQHSRAQVPSCLVVDVELPDMGGLDLQALLRDQPQVPVIFTAKRPDLRTAVLAIKAGAVEFLPEPVDEHLLLSAVRTAIQCSHAALVRKAETGVLSSRYAALSPREGEVMALVILGKLNKVIADDLGISEITVKAHRGRVMRKMKAASLPDLVNMAARLSAPATGHSGWESAAAERWPLPTGRVRALRAILENSAR
jgi:FixJ family two-component response regulator